MRTCKLKISGWNLFSTAENAGSGMILDIDNTVLNCIILDFISHKNYFENIFYGRILKSINVVNWLDWQSYLVMDHNGFENAEGEKYVTEKATKLKKISF